MTLESTTMDLLRYRVQQHHTKGNRQPLTVAVLLFDGFNLLDAFGCLELWGDTRAFQKKASSIRLLSLGVGAKTIRPMDCDADSAAGAIGPMTVVDYVVGEEEDMEEDKDDTLLDLPDIDVLLIPGGAAVERLWKDEPLRTRCLPHVKQLLLQTAVVCTVGQSSFLLAELGFLSRKHPATTCLQVFGVDHPTSSKKKGNNNNNNKNSKEKDDTDNNNSNNSSSDTPETPNNKTTTSNTTPGTIPPTPPPSKLYPNLKWDKLARWTCQPDSSSSSSSSSSNNPPVASPSSSAIYTCGGATAAMDLTCHLLSELYGEEVAKRTTQLAEYTPNRDSDYSYETSPRPMFTPGTKAQQFDDVSQRKYWTLACLLVDECQLLELAGPLHLLGSANRALGYAAFSVTYFAEFDTVRVRHGGVQFQAQHSLEHVLRHDSMERFDLLLLPGGPGGRLREVSNPKFTKALQSLEARSTHVVAIGDGAALLATLGVLDFKLATGPKALAPALPLYGPHTEWKPQARWMVDGKYHTSRGVSAGLEVMLYWISRVVGANTARAAAEDAEYLWNPHSVPDYGYGEYVTGKPRSLVSHAHVAYLRLCLWMVRWLYFVGMQILGLSMRHVAKYLNKE